jgi:hypothetical protein
MLKGINVIKLIRWIYKGKKSIDYKDFFCEKKGDHLTLEGIEEINKIKKKWI